MARLGARMINSLFSIRHGQSGLVGTTLEVVLEALKRFPPGSYPVYRHGGSSWWTSARPVVCVIAERRASGQIEFRPYDFAVNTRPSAPFSPESSTVPQVVCGEHGSLSRFLPPSPVHLDEPTGSRSDSAAGDSAARGVDGVAEAAPRVGLASRLV